MFNGKYGKMQLQELLETGANVTVAVSVEELKAAFTQWCAEAMAGSACGPKGGADALLTREEASRLLKVNNATLWRWNREGYLPAVKVGRRVMYRRSDIEGLAGGG